MLFHENNEWYVELNVIDFYYGEIKELFHRRYYKYESNFSLSTFQIIAKLK